MRNLAQRSAAAAKEIKALIDDSVGNVEKGSTLVAQAGATMEEIVEGIRRVTDVMGEITAATQEQTAGIEQINQAISQMDQATQQNASLVEEVAAASEAMQKQAGDLAAAVRVFKIDDMQTVPVVDSTRTIARSSGNKAPMTIAGEVLAPPQAKRLATRPTSTNESWEEF